MQDIELLKEKLEKISTKNYDNAFLEKIKDNERLRLEKEETRKQIHNEDKIVQEQFFENLISDVLGNKKIFGYIKRYVIIGMATGVPGIAITYLLDKWQENQFIKQLYKKNIEAVANADNKQLYKEFEILRRNFNKVYNIDEIEDWIKTSREINKLKNNTKEIKKLSDDIQKYRNEYIDALKCYIENQIKNERKEFVKQDKVDEEDEEDSEEIVEISVHRS